MVGGAEASRKEGAPTRNHIFCESFLRGETATPPITEDNKPVIVELVSATR